MAWVIAFNILIGFSCLGGIFWLYRRQEHGTRSQEDLLDSIREIQACIGQDLAKRISHAVFVDLSRQLKEIPLPVVKIEGLQKTPDTPQISTPIQGFQNFGPLALDKPISTLSLSEALRRRLPGQIQQIMDLFATSTVSLSLKPELAHELNTALVGYAVQNLDELDGFQRIIQTSLQAYKLPQVADDQILETVGDAIRYEWKDPTAERRFAQALRRVFSKFILDYSVPGFSEVCERELKTFGLSTRLENLLRSRDITTVEDLISHTASSLKKITNFGQKSVDEARTRVLVPNHLHFGTLDLPT